jgi:hypothetical protein
VKNVPIGYIFHTGKTRCDLGPLQMATPLPQRPRSSDEIDATDASSTAWISLLGSPGSATDWLACGVQTSYCSDQLGVMLIRPAAPAWEFSLLCSSASSGMIFL